MGRRGLLGGAIALGVAGLLAAFGPGTDPPAAAPALTGALGAGAPEALLATPLPALRFAVPVGGHASLRLGFLAGPSCERALEVELALVALLGVPGEWPFDGVFGVADAAPALETAAASVPEPGSLALLVLGTAGLAGARTLRPRRPAGRDPARLSP